MSHFMGVGIFWIGLYRTGLSCWRLTLRFDTIPRRGNVASCLSFAIFEHFSSSADTVDY